MTREQEDEMDALSISESIASDKVDEQHRQQEESTQGRAPTISPGLVGQLLPPIGGADEAKETNTLTESGDKIDQNQKQQEEKVQVIELTISPIEARSGETKTYHMSEQEENVQEKEKTALVAHTEAKKADHDKDQKQAHQGEEQQIEPNALTTCQDEATKAERCEREAEHKVEEQEKVPDTFKAGARKTGNSMHFITMRVWSTKERQWMTVQRPTVSQSHAYLAI